jgi:Rrf2 family transcriptional regulator, iron-sulfur cluster assembly transcription factor
MSGLFQASDAAALGLHAALLLAQAPGERRRTGEMARTLKVSAAHLAKVMQRLEQAGLVSGLRGPGGGYQLARPAPAISLAEVYQAVEGTLHAGRCPFNVPVCDNHGCVLGSYFGDLNRRVLVRLKRTKLSAVRLKLGVKR